MRELISRISHKKVLSTNPKCDFRTVVVDKRPSIVDIQFCNVVLLVANPSADGTEESFFADGEKCKNMLERIQLKIARLELDALKAEK